MRTDCLQLPVSMATNELYWVGVTSSRPCVFVCVCGQRWGQRISRNKEVRKRRVNDMNEGDRSVTSLFKAGNDITAQLFSTYRTLYWMKQNNEENFIPVMKINKSFSLSHRSPETPAAHFLCCCCRFLFKPGSRFDFLTVHPAAPDSKEILKTWDSDPFWHGINAGERRRSRGVKEERLVRVETPAAAILSPKYPFKINNKNNLSVRVKRCHGD